MKITRHGERAFHGVKAVGLENVKAKWNAPSKELHITSANAAFDFNTNAKHIYNVKLSLEEAAILIKELGDNCGSIQIDELESAFIPVVPSLLRLLNATCRA